MGQKFSDLKGILRLRNPNLGPNSGKRILDARILDPNSWVEFFDSVFSSKRGPLKNSPSRNSPPKIHLPKFNPEIGPKNSHCTSARPPPRDTLGNQKKCCRRLSSGECSRGCSLNRGNTAQQDREPPRGKSLLLRGSLAEPSGMVFIVEILQRFLEVLEFSQRFCRGSSELGPPRDPALQTLSRFPSPDCSQNYYHCTLIMIARTELSPSLGGD